MTDQQQDEDRAELMKLWEGLAPGEFRVIEIGNIPMAIGVVRDDGVFLSATKGGEAVNGPAY